MENEKVAVREKLMRKALERADRSVVLALLIGITVILNLLVRSESGAIQQISFIIALVTMAYICWAAGMDLRSIGLTSGNPKRIITWCVQCVAITFVLVFCAYLLNERWFLDHRYDKNLTETLIYIFITIPLVTVVFEELLFRGILWGFVRDHWNAKTATITSSLLFGLWHILSARGMDKSFLIDAGIPHVLALPLLMVGTVFATFCAGVILCEIRRRTESLWAPMVLHWAINASAVVMVYLAWH